MIRRKVLPGMFLGTTSLRTYMIYEILIYEVCIYSKMSSLCPKCEKCECEPTNADKWRYTLLTTVVFLIVVNPMTYKLVQKLFANVLGNVANPVTGCPTYVGIAVHTIIFTLLLRYVMDLDI